MSSFQHLVSLEAVVETPWLDELGTPPWPHAEHAPFRWLRLWEGCDLLEVGLVCIQLADYNHVEPTGPPPRILQHLLEQDRWILPGGLRARGPSVTIDPGCCSGLEDWGSWFDLAPGRTAAPDVWWGHDPSPWISVDGDAVALWSDGGVPPAGGRVPKPIGIETTRAQVVSRLRDVRRDLRGFLERLHRFAVEVAPATARPFVDRFDAEFGCTTGTW